MRGELKKWIRDIPDFPKKGILFRDISPALLDAGAFKDICDRLCENYREREFDKVAGIEARGFFFASILAYRLGKGLIPIRKPGKLPWKTISESYSLEYGEATLEMHRDAVSKGERVLIIDDLLATGGTAAAAAKLVEKLGGEVEEFGFVIELSALKGRDRIQDKPVFVLLQY
ncbi:MAG: adenine phosphoribosyltransferase [Candidatus Krumholzibacteriota bacterium]|nr:adenine phosphoribosyltransferase [Candidatus Krumholzibacteriota bacterium]